MGEDAGVPLPRRAGPLELFALADFRRIWLSGSCVGVMRWLELLAIAVHVYRTTGQPLLVALFTLLRFLPLTLLGAFLGALSERFARRSLLLVGLVVACLASLAMAAALLAGHQALGLLALVTLISGTFFAAEFPVRRTLTAEIAGRERIGPAMGLESATMNATRMLGPPLGGLLLETGGLALVFLLGALLYGLAAILVSGLRTGARPSGGGGRLLGQVVEGLRHLRHARLIVGVLAVTVLFNLFGFAYIAMVPVIGAERLGLGAVAIGVLMAAEGLGSLLGALAIAWWARPAWHGRIYLGGTGLFLVSVLVFAAAPSFPLALAAQIAAGLGVAAFGTMQSALILEVAPLELRGRMMGLLAVCIGTSPFGMLLQGALAQRLGAAAAVALVAVAGLVALGLAVATWPELWRRRAGGDQSSGARPLR